MQLMKDNSIFDAIGVDGMKYADFRKKLTPRYVKVWKDIATGYVVIMLIMAASIYLESASYVYFWMFIPLISLVVGYTFAYIQLFCHEAIHFNLHPNKAKNDVLANIFLFSWVGNDIDQCRERHWQHHQYFGTTKDPENIYFKPISTQLIFSILSSIYFVKNILIKRFVILFYKMPFTKKRRQIFMFLVGLILNLSILVICFKSSYWQTALIWLFAIIIFYPLFSTVRQILENRNRWADSKTDYKLVDHGKVMRTFNNDFFSRTFGGAGFNRKMLHQLDPEISYTRFDDLEAFLKDCPKYWVEIYRSKTSYFDTYLWLVR